MDESPTTAVWAQCFFHGQQRQQQQTAVSGLLALLTGPRGAIKDLGQPWAASTKPGAADGRCGDEDAAGSSAPRPPSGDARVRKTKPWDPRCLRQDQELPGCGSSPETFHINLFMGCVTGHTLTDNTHSHTHTVFSGAYELMKTDAAQLWNNSVLKQMEVMTLWYSFTHVLSSWLMSHVTNEIKPKGTHHLIQLFLLS